MTSPARQALLRGMPATRDRAIRQGLTSTQTGAIGELAVAGGLLIASGGRLAPFRPVADDDGIDLLIYDKRTRRCLPLQVKSRTRGDGAGGRTVQFDVQATTYDSLGGGMLLGAMMDGLQLKWAWLVPMSALQHSARKGDGKLVVVASTIDAANDKWARYRHRSFTTVAEALIESLQLPMPRDGMARQ